MRAAVSGVSKYQSTGAGADESLGRRFRRNSLSRAAAADRDGIAQDEPLVFIPRQVPLTPATRGGFAVFMVFLVTFTIIVRMERNDDVFFFVARPSATFNRWERLVDVVHQILNFKGFLSNVGVSGNDSF